MIQRTIHALTYNVISPSFYELACRPCIDISYLGDKWLLHVPDPDTGQPLLEPFKSLDDAARYVALAF